MNQLISQTRPRLTKLDYVYGAPYNNEQAYSSNRLVRQPLSFGHLKIESQFIAPQNDYVRGGVGLSLPKTTLDEIEELNFRIEDQQTKLSQITRKRELENARYDPSHVSPQI